MSKVNFPITTFYNSDGSPVANGYVLLNLSRDAQSPSSQQLCAGAVTKMLLNSSGGLQAVPFVWPNSQLLPTGTAYIMRVYSANGQLVSGPTKVTV